MKRFLLVVFIFSLFACKKNDNSTPAIKQEQLAQQAIAIIEKEINTAIADKVPIDYSTLLSKIKEINGIKQVDKTPSGVALNVVTTAGNSFNFLLQTQSSENSFRDFKLDGQNIKVNSTSTSIPPPAIIKASNIKPGNMKALILAPFQEKLKLDLSTIKRILENAGYSVKYLYDQEADVEKFTGDYLADYGVIFISTHGFSDCPLPNDPSSTTLVTGEQFSDEKKKALPNTIVDSYIPKSTIHYFGVTVPYLKSTLKKKFPNSWVFVEACESGKNNDLSNFFLQNGAQIFNGFSLPIVDYLADAVSVELTAYLANGYEMDKAVEIIRLYQYLNGSMIAYTDGNRISTINSLVTRKISSAPFNLISYFNAYAISPIRYGYPKVGEVWPITIMMNQYAHNESIQYKNFLLDHSSSAFKCTGLLQRPGNYFWPDPKYDKFSENWALTLQFTDVKWNGPFPKAVISYVGLINSERQTVYYLPIPYTLIR